MRTIAVAATAVLIGACAEPAVTHLWARPDGSTAGFDQENAQCEAQALAAPTAEQHNSILKACLIGKGWINVGVK